jgi:hypothetical protein
MGSIRTARVPAAEREKREEILLKIAAPLQVEE